MPPARTVCTLLYHHVGPLREPRCQGLTVAPESFARQMATLSAMGYTAILPDDWVAHARDGSDCPERCVMVTFDDAYADLVDHALPVMEKHGYPATVFVATSLVGKSINCNPDHPDAQLPIMSAKQIAEWSKRGVVFGSHSLSHADLTSLAHEDAVHEIEASRDELAAITGTDVKAFAYPYGKVNDQIAALVHARYDIAFGIEEGINDPSVPIHRLRRTMVQHGDSVVDVLLRARYGKSVLQRVRSMARSVLPESNPA